MRHKLFCSSYGERLKARYKGLEAVRSPIIYLVDVNRLWVHGKNVLHWGLSSDTHWYRLKLKHWRNPTTQDQGSNSRVRQIMLNQHSHQGYLSIGYPQRMITYSKARGSFGYTSIDIKLLACSSTGSPKKAFLARIVRNSLDKIGLEDEGLFVKTFALPGSSKPSRSIALW